MPETGTDNTVFECRFDDDIVPAISSFEEMNLRTELLRGVKAMFECRPSYIQQRAVPAFACGSDVFIRAGRGCGKTGALLIGLLQRVDFCHRQLQGLVLSPTRELAQQTHAVISSIGGYLNGDGAPFCHIVVRDVPARDDQFQAGIIAVGTPGRISDVIKRGALHTDSLRVLILDEADEMLSFGFLENVYAIFKSLPVGIQVALSTSTTPAEVLTLTSKCLRRPICILGHCEDGTLEGVRQHYVAVEQEYKLETLLDLYGELYTTIGQSVIFANTRDAVDSIAQQLSSSFDSSSVVVMHNAMTASECDGAVAQFRSGCCRTLVTTDIENFKINTTSVAVVVNYDVPTSHWRYVHRIGRSGKFGRKGLCINLVSEEEVARLRDIEATYNIKVEELPMNFADFVG